MSLREKWNKISSAYQEEFFKAWYQLNKAETYLIENPKSKKVLCLGCGGGQDLIELARKGAIITAIDSSEKQIKFAKNLAEQNKVNINYRIMNINSIEKFQKNSFDVVYSSYALGYVKNLKKLFSKVNNILIKGGIFIFSLSHPLMEAGRWVKVKNREYFVVDDYFKEGKKTWKWSFSKIKEVNFFDYHRTLQTFFDSLVSNCFEVEKILEPYPIKRISGVVEHYQYEKMRRIPYTIVFKARKK